MRLVHSDFCLRDIEKKDSAAVEAGAWDAVHLVTTSMDANKKCKYRLNSTIYLTLDMSNEVLGKVAIAGHVAKVKEEFHQLKDSDKD